MVSILFSMVVGYLAADLLTGLGHFVIDRYLKSSWPIIGKYIAAPNERHHADQTAFLNQSYWRRNWTTIIPGALALSIAAICHAPAWSLWMWFFVSQGNEIHAWTHRRAKSRIVRGLQEFGVLQSPRHHAVHHRAPFDCRFCPLTDFFNPVLDKLRVWSALEWLAFRLFGIRTK